MSYQLPTAYHSSGINQLGQVADEVYHSCPGLLSPERVLDDMFERPSQIQVVTVIQVGTVLASSFCH
jgi:hypothetical protein